MYASGDKKAISGKKMELKINRDICCRSAREYRDRQKDWQSDRIETYAEESNLTDKNKQTMLYKIAQKYLTFYRVKPLMCPF